MASNKILYLDFHLQIQVHTILITPNLCAQFLRDNLGISAVGITAINYMRYCRYMYS